MVLSAKDFKMGEMVITKSGILGKVVGIYGHYLQVEDGDGYIRVLIPSHGEVKPVCINPKELK